MLPALPENAQKILRSVAAAGGSAFLVGGALRDLLLHKSPKDWDFATTLTPPQLLRAFPGAKLIGGSCGTVQAPFGTGRCEITPCRTEGAYSDKRHPDEVHFVPDILADLARRDFTVNAMAYDGAVLLDPFGGQQDLKRRLLRCVGDPAVRFAEDPLRILRLFRLASQLGFTASWETFCAANDAMHTIATLPAERVLGEVRRILMGDGPQVLGGIIAGGGLSAYGFFFAPPLVPLADTPREPLCRWWALMALCGATPAVVGAAFGFAQHNMDRLEECGRLYRTGPAQDNVQLKMKLRATKIDYAPLAATFAAISPPFAAEPTLFATVCANHEPYRLSDLAVNGDMLMYEGIKGEKCGRVLNELLAAVIKNPQLNKTPVLLGLARSLKEII